MTTLPEPKLKMIPARNLEAKIETVTPEMARTLEAYKNISSKVEIVTRNMAVEFLENQIKNRKRDRDQIDSKKSEITSKNWMVNGQGIITNKKGQLMDGQHRLMAFLESGVEFLPMLVTRGIADEAVKTIDVGKKRSVGDIFQMQGVYNSKLISRTAKLLYIWTQKHDELMKRGSFGKEISNIPPQQIYNYYLENQMWIDHACSEFRKNSEVIIGAGGAVLAFVFAILEKIDSDKCYIFITSFTNGNIKPEWAYMVKVRDALITRNRKIRFTEGERISLLFGLWNVIYHGYSENDVIKTNLNIPHELKK